MDVELDLAEKLLHGYQDPTIRPSLVPGFYAELKDIPIGQAKPIVIPYGDSFRDKGRSNSIFTSGSLLKTIYRLALIGLVEDWTVDYSHHRVTVFGVRRTSAEYLFNLRSYLRRYISVEKVERLISSVLPEEGEPKFRDLLRCLIAFVYEEVAQKRQRAEEDMVTALKDGASKGAKEFRETLNLYFTSKYYIDLHKDNDSGRAGGIEIVWKYFDICQGRVDNFKHLRGACTRILSASPSNGGILCLLAICRILLEPPHSASFGPELDALVRGLNVLGQENGWSKQQAWDVGRAMFERIRTQTSHVGQHIQSLEDVAHLKVLRSVIAEINQQMSFVE